MTAVWFLLLNIVCKSVVGRIIWATGSIARGLDQSSDDRCTVCTVFNGKALVGFSDCAY
jgi:hypothetical protein